MQDHRFVAQRRSQAGHVIASRLLKHPEHFLRLHLSMLHESPVATAFGRVIRRCGVLLEHTDASGAGARGDEVALGVEEVDEICDGRVQAALGGLILLCELGERQRLELRKASRPFRRDCGEHWRRCRRPVDATAPYGRQSTNSSSLTAVQLWQSAIWRGSCASAQTEGPACERPNQDLRGKKKAKRRCRWFLGIRSGVEPGNAIFCQVRRHQWKNPLWPPGRVARRVTI
eukprot:scaffold1307_cov200-Pinguiococcus_pyrenoidosus.AAC.119